jgi:hypothetical protein
VHFSLKGLKGRDRFENPGEDRWIILNCILKKQVVKVLTGFNRVWIWLNESESYITTDGQSASLSWNKVPIWGLFYYSQTVAGLLMWGALSNERTGPTFTMLLASPAQPFSGPSPVGLANIFYCPRYETSLFVASYDSQGYGGDIRPRLHTGWPNGMIL